MQVENVPGLPAGYVLVKAPTHKSDPGQIVMVKKASYLKGQYPKQLEKFKGQIKECPPKCAGQTGQGYRLCLMTCAAEKKKSAEEKKKWREAYTSKYRDMIRKMKPRVMVEPKISVA